MRKNATIGRPIPPRYPTRRTASILPTHAYSAVAGIRDQKKPKRYFQKIKAIPPDTMIAAIKNAKNDW